MTNIFYSVLLGKKLLSAKECKNIEVLSWEICEEIVEYKMKASCGTYGKKTYVIFKAYLFYKETCSEQLVKLSDN
jgi:hypothetical protein